MHCKQHECPALPKTYSSMHSYFYHAKMYNESLCTDKVQMARKTVIRCELAAKCLHQCIPSTVSVHIYLPFPPGSITVREIERQEAKSESSKRHVGRKLAMEPPWQMNCSAIPQTIVLIRHLDVSFHTRLPNYKKLLSLFSSAKNDTSAQACPPGLAGVLG